MEPMGNKLHIKEWRKLRGLTQDALAEAAGVNRITIAKYETGDMSPSLANASKIAAALGCTVDELLRDVIVEV